MENIVKKVRKKRPNSVNGYKPNNLTIGEKLPTNKSEFVMDHAGIRPKGFVVEMPKSSIRTLAHINQIYNHLDEIEDVCGKHPEYSIARMSLNQVLLDVAGNIDKEVYENQEHPADLKTILVSELEKEDVETKVHE